MTSRVSRFSPFADRAVAALAAARGLPRRLGARAHVVLGARPDRRLADVPRSYGRSMRDGLVPYRDFAVEYPPGALPVFVLPTWLHGDYASSFAWLMALVRRAARRGRGVAAAGGRVLSSRSAPLLVGSLILSRFDLWPALLATASLGTAPARPASLRLGAARRSRRRQAVAARAGAARARLVDPPRAAARAARRGGRAARRHAAVRDRLARWALGQHQRPGVAAVAGREPGRGVPDDVLAPA